MTSETPTGPSVFAVPDGDTFERLTCPDCGYIEYQNPKVIVGAVVTWESKFLLCRRAIKPRKGYWTMPAGYMEMHETIADGAKREVWEEACAVVRIDGLIGVYEIRHLSQVYMVFRAEMLNDKFAAGEESEEVGLFTWDEIPWDDLAFPSVRWALHGYRDGLSAHHGQAPLKPPGNW